MIDRNHELSVSRQARILGISRGSVYYLPQPASVVDLALMRRIDELHLDYPFAGSRMLQGLLNAEGHDVGRLHVRTLMRKMGIKAIYRRPNTSKPAPGHKVYPYLLKNLAITPELKPPQRQRPTISSQEANPCPRALPLLRPNTNYYFAANRRFIVSCARS